MNDMVQVPSDLKIGMNARELYELLEIAKRAPMLRAERLWLGQLADDVAQRAANLLEQRRVERQQAEAADSQRALAEQQRTEAQAEAEREERRQRRLKEQADAKAAGVDKLLGELPVADAASSDVVGSGSGDGAEGDGGDKAGESGDKSAAAPADKPKGKK